ncbi:MAG: phospholipase D-like domain-containing protein [Candidatus Brocadiia bacterium]
MLRRAIVFIVIVAALYCCGCDALVTRPGLAARRLFGRLPTGHEFTSQAFDDAMTAVAHSPMRKANSATFLCNGEQIFPCMLADIRRAKREILFATYIYHSDDVGLAFAKALAERAKAGVQVRVLYDFFGSISITDREPFDILRDAGAKVNSFNPIESWTILRLNNRLHAKMMVVDGEIGYTMGHNISNKYNEGGLTSGKWRDSGMRIEGPVALDLRSCFAYLWQESTGAFFKHRIPLPIVDLVATKITQAFSGRYPWPPKDWRDADEELKSDQVVDEALRAPSKGNAPARVLFTEPGWWSEEIYQAILLAIRSSNKSIDITHGYFLPDHPIALALREAASRGVKVRVLMADVLDLYLTKKTSLECTRRLCRKGVEIYAYSSALLHSKTIVVDGIWSTVGSTNMNGRSFFLNYECNLEVIDAAFAAQLTEAFERDIRHSLLLKEKDLRPRNPLQWLIQQVLYVAKDQL